MANEQVQRRWQAACPNCGAPVEFASAASASAVCSFCRSTLVREGEALRKIGVSAELIEDYSPLQLGASGRYLGEPFIIVGRIQYGYAEGSWNEWHALFDSGRSGWLSEDNGAFVMAFEAPLGADAPPDGELELDGRRIIQGQAWTVSALTQARVAAAQGELPHAPPPEGQIFRIAELRSTQDEVGTLDYADPAAPQWSIGRPVRIADLAMRGLREGEASANLASRALPCPNCGAALEPKLGSTLSLSCPQCRAVVDISKGAGADLAHFEQSYSGDPQIPLGRMGTLAFAGGAPAAWQVVGYQERCDIPESSEDEQTFWREYLLFNKAEGFIFLVDTEEGWSLVRPLTGAPAGSGNSVTWAGKTFRRQYSYTAKTTYVLGEFYWQVRRDERALVIDYQGPGGALLSREQTGNEITWSHGAKIDAAQVQKAFRLSEVKLDALRRDASPLGEGGGGSLTSKIVVGIFILLILVIMLTDCSGRSDDCQAYKDSYGESSAEYQQCRRNSSGSGVRSSGGSWGGFSSGGGGHK